MIFQRADKRLDRRVLAHCSEHHARCYTDSLRIIVQLGAERLDGGSADVSQRDFCPAAESPSLLVSMAMSGSTALGSVRSLPGSGEARNGTDNTPTTRELMVVQRSDQRIDGLGIAYRS